MNRYADFKTNEEYWENHKTNVVLVEALINRLPGNPIKVTFNNKEAILYSIEGNPEEDKTLAFTFDLLNGKEDFLYVDLATEYLPFDMIEDNYFKLFKNYLEEKTSISYQAWLENKILKE